MRKTEINEVLTSYENIYTALGEARKESSIVPSMDGFLRLLLIKRLEEIGDELDGLREMLAIELDEQDTKEFVQKILNADEADDEQEFLNLVENAENLE